MSKSGGRWYSHWQMWVSLLVVLIILYLGWFFFMGYVECDDRQCFNTNLAPCIRTKYTGGTDMIYEYIIIGETDNRCEVQVKLVQGELNNRDSLKLEGRMMICSLPFGVVMNPESNMGDCHGPLKEGLQDLIIQKLHAYLVQNLGRINLEILDLPISVS